MFMRGAERQIVTVNRRTYSQIAQRCHDLCAIGIANAAAVFVKAPVATVMQLVFDGEVAKHRIGQTPFIDLFVR